MKHIDSLVQSSRLILNIGTEISGVGGVTTSHHGHLSSSIIDEHGSEVVAASGLADGVHSGTVASSELGGVDLLQLVVGVADEVIDEKDSGIGVRRLALGVCFEGAVSISKTLE
jgi:hypothetical protein